MDWSYSLDLPSSLNSSMESSNLTLEYMNSSEYRNSSLDHVTKMLLLCGEEPDPEIINPARYTG